MRSPILPFRAALKTLVAACGVLLLLMTALHVFPRLSERPRLHAREIASNEAIPLSQIERDDDVFVEPEQEDGIESSPLFDGRVDDLERQVHTLESRLLEASAVHGRLLQSATQRNETHASELSALTARLEMTERQLQSALTRDCPAPEAKPSAEESRIAIRAGDSDAAQLLIQAREASLPELLARLGDFAGVNLLIAPTVNGAASLHLESANIDEALETICRLHDCRLEYIGDSIIVSGPRPVAPAPSEAERPQTLVKLYHLQHIRGADLQPYVQLLLTPGVGGVASAPGSKHVPGDDPKALLVRDTPTVLAEVERLLQELDRGSAIAPPELLPPVSAPAPAIVPQSPAPPAASPRVSPPPRPMPKYSESSDMSWRRPAPQRPDCRRDCDSRSGGSFKLSALRDLMPLQQASHSESTP